MLSGEAAVWPAPRVSAAGQPLPSPEALRTELRLAGRAAATVRRGRAEARAVLDGTDDRLLVVVGPCSLHDPDAALEYASKLARTGFDQDLLIVMRTYVEKPRTVTGWPGLIADPDMDGSYDVGRGLRIARRLLLDVASLGLPAACEWLHPLTAHYLSDTVTWGAIGARTTESQLHRQLASSLPMPIGFKNRTDGDVQVAIDACLAAAARHTSIGMAPDGTLAAVTTAGNPYCHVVLRGGRSGPNYSAADVSQALRMIDRAGLPRRVVIDASHGNSAKDHRRQPLVAAALADQIVAGAGPSGVMLESFLLSGRQEPGDRATLRYGQSITDACMDFGTTVKTLRTIATAVRQRRQITGTRQVTGTRRRPAIVRAAPASKRLRMTETL